MLQSAFWSKKNVVTPKKLVPHYTPTFAQPPEPTILLACGREWRTSSVGPGQSSRSLPQARIKDRELWGRESNRYFHLSPRRPLRRDFTTASFPGSLFFRGREEERPWERGWFDCTTLAQNFGCFIFGFLTNFGHSDR